MLKLRLITAVILLLVFLSALFLLPWLGFVAFVTLVVVIGSWEWSNLSGLNSFLQRCLYTLSTLILLLLTAYYCGFFTSVLSTTTDLAVPSIEKVKHILLLASCWWAFALLWVQAYPSSAILWGGRIVRALMGWLVLIPMWLATIYLDYLLHGPFLVLLLLATVVVADSGAYFFGRAFGKRKLAPAVSPGKSWEGFLGGLFCSALLAVVVAVYTDFILWQALLMILLFTALSSVLGDLLESMVKRHRGIKDSGTILPGHGGVMDRIDSVTAAAPIFVLGLLLSGWPPS